MIGRRALRAVARLNRLGLRCKALGRYRQGRAYYQRALALLGGDGGPHRSAVATLYHNLGGIEHARGNYPAGAAFACRGLALRLGSPDADAGELAADAIALAAILDGLDAAAEAEQLYLGGLRLLHVAGARSPSEIAVGLNGLGALRVRCGDHRRGLRLLQRSAALKERVLGGAHPDLAVTLNNLGVAVARMGHSAGAVRLFDRAVAIADRGLGAGHPTTLACRANAARWRAGHASATGP